MDEIIYTPGQVELIDKLKNWYEHFSPSKPYFSYSGAAGTGKTTVVREIVNQLNLSEKDNEFICAAYTGKAVLQLIRNELPARTIHSLIFHTYTDREKVVDENGVSRWVLKMVTVLKEALDPRLKLIFIDEATMVNDDYRDKLLSFGVPIVFIGDMNQLPPVFGVSSVMMNPDYILTQIMRQKEGSPIIQLSQMVLAGIPLKPGTYGQSRVVTSVPADGSLLFDYDQIICAKNKTREDLTTFIRADLLRRRSQDPVVGDKIICRQNNWDKEVNGISLTNGLNGMLIDIDKSTAHKGYYTIAFQPDFMDQCFEDIHMDLRYMRADYQQKQAFGLSQHDKFEYGYVITCHLSQGSQWPRVLFIDERFGDYETNQRLRYTAITRASSSIDIVVENYHNPYAKWYG